MADAERMLSSFALSQIKLHGKSEDATDQEDKIPTPQVSLVSSGWRSQIDPSEVA